MSVLYTSRTIMCTFHAFSAEESSVYVFRMNESFRTSQTNTILNTSLTLLGARIANGLLLVSIETRIAIFAVIGFIISLTAH